MRVLSVAYPYAPVRACAVGGAEQILGVLDRALVAAGHTSLVVACEGSSPAGTLFSAPCPEGALDAVDRRWWNARYQVAIDRALASARVDLIHMHGMDFHEYTLPANIPVLVTLHMPLDWHPVDLWHRLPANVTLQCVSLSQRAAGPNALRGLPVIPNGIDLPVWNTNVQREHYAMALGRICPEKNVHEALEAGTRAGLPVRIGGQVFPYTAHQQYFQRKVQPGLTGVHELLGPLDAERRTALLGRAKCLLHPTLAPETSSLVAMEALAMGTPVIAYRSGALPEIVEDGVTGYLVDDVDGMVEAIRQIDRIRPEDCRAAAERRFGQDAMVTAYFDLYRDLLRGSQARYA